MLFLFVFQEHLIVLLSKGNNYLREKNLGNIDLEFLKIFKEVDEPKFSVIKIIYLFLPPLFIKILDKVKNIIS